MQSEDTIEILDLEYEVAGLGATEASNTEENHAAWFVFHFRLPENSI